MVYLKFDDNKSDLFGSIYVEDPSSNSPSHSVTHKMTHGL